jgi:Bifunctional DNA primase/polymerase, N-terminal
MNMPLMLNAPTVPRGLPAVDTNRQVAIRLAKSGLRIFPAVLTFNEKTRRWDKQPSLSGWQDKATTDLAQIEKWWELSPDSVPG